MPLPAHEKVIVKPPCNRCGQPYLRGTDTTCATCLRRDRDPKGKHPRVPLKCDCGEPAVAVILVRILVGELTYQEPLAVCEECLGIEVEMAREYL